MNTNEEREEDDVGRRGAEDSERDDNNWPRKARRTRNEGLRELRDLNNHQDTKGTKIESAVLKRPERKGIRRKDAKTERVDFFAGPILGWNWMSEFEILSGNKSRRMVTQMTQMESMGNLYF